MKEYGKFKKENPLVSITIAAHNEEKYISGAIESLLLQTYKNIEIIIVDDKSTDNTALITEGYKTKGVKLIKRNEQGGPGSAYNTGAENSKGDILMFFDADHIYGKNYVMDLVKPIISGEALCTIHNQENIANKNNFWARAFGKRICTQSGRGKIFTLIRRDVFDDLGPFDPSLGYADDQTLNIKHGLTSLGIDTEIAHFNPDSLKVHWGHGKWVGRSNQKPWKIIGIFPLFPVYVIYKTIKQIIDDPYINFLWFLPIYHTIKYFSYFFGAIERLKNKKNVV